MRRVLLAVALFLLPSLAYAQETMIANGTSLTDWQEVVGDCQITSVSSATSPSSCSGGIPAGTV